MASKPPKLFVRCKTCGVEFWSAIRCEKEKFKRFDFGGNRHFCPNGHINRYEKKDYYFKE